MSRKGARLGLNFRHIQDGTGVVGGFHDGKSPRQDEVLVEAEGSQNLLRYDIAAAVAGNHQTVDSFFTKIMGSEQCSEPVDHGGEVGAQGIVVIR